MRTQLSAAPLAFVAAAIVLAGVTPLARAEQPEETRDATTSAVEVAQPAARLSAQEIEKQVLALLSAGEQSEAENLLSDQLGQMSESLHLTELLAKSQNREAGRYFVAHRNELLQQQRVLFLTAALTRSRFDKQGALLLFNTVYAIEPETAAGQCAFSMLKLDTTQRTGLALFTVGQAFTELRNVVAKHPDDIMVRWMLAVQCRTWNQDAEGAELYRQILEQWNPGPALVHQTYANLLDDLGRYEEALQQRYLTVKMEPASWSYDGLGNTLDSLERHKEARAAHQIAVSMNPGSASHLINWGNSLCGDQQYDAAIEKCQRALELHPTHFRAFWVWGKSLAGKGDLEGAVAKYDQAIAIDPGESKMRQEAKELRDRISKGELTGARLNEAGNE